LSTEVFSVTLYDLGYKIGEETPRKKEDIDKSNSNMSKKIDDSFDKKESKNPSHFRSSKAERLYFYRSVLSFGVFLLGL